MIIRTALPADAEAIARVRVETWRSAYAGILPAEYLAALSVEESTWRWRETLLESTRAGTFTLVAEDAAGEVVGFATGGPERTADPYYSGEIYAIYVHPGSQRQGAGRALVEAGRQRLVEMGYEKMLIWVLKRNTPSRAFYKAMGGKLWREKLVEIGSQLYQEVAYAWDSPLTLPKSG